MTFPPPLFERGGKEIFPGVFFLGLSQPFFGPANRSPTGRKNHLLKPPPFPKESGAFWQQRVLFHPGQIPPPPPPRSDFLNDSPEFLTIIFILGKEIHVESAFCISYFMFNAVAGFFCLLPIFLRQEFNNTRRSLYF